MRTSDPKGWHSRGYLPHFDSPGTVQHVVFRTAGSLPPAILDGLPLDPQKRRRAAGAFLDGSQFDTVLAERACAEIVQSTLLHFDGERYRLLAWCVMPNHVHVALEQCRDWQLGGVIKSWKSFSAHRINAFRRTPGSVWAADYFDRYVRNEDQLGALISYVETNPVKANLTKLPEDWLYSSARLRGNAP